MMYNAQKIAALRRCMAKVLKAHFTKEELAYLNSAGITVSSVISSGDYDIVSRADGQKTCMTLMSRWALDDSEDLIIWAWKGAVGNEIIFRDALGAANKDGWFGNLAGTVVDTAGNWLGKLGITPSGNLRAGSDRSGFNRVTGMVVAPMEENDIETVDPAITLNNSATLSTFFRMISETGSANPNTI
jgi:hypothetical protein